jgi:hypothetical protein
MTDKFYIKQNDRQPYYFFQFLDSAKVPVSILGSTIVCTMKNIDTGTVKINRSACVIDDGPDGKGHYEWGTTDTDTIGRYYIEFEVTPAAGPTKKYTRPADPEESAEVEIIAQLDAV